MSSNPPELRVGTSLAVQSASDSGSRKSERGRKPSSGHKRPSKRVHHLEDDRDFPHVVDQSVRNELIKAIPILPVVPASFGRAIFYLSGPSESETTMEADDTISGKPLTPDELSQFNGDEEADDLAGAAAEEASREDDGLPKANSASLKSARSFDHRPSSARQQYELRKLADSLSSADDASAGGSSPLRFSSSSSRRRVDTEGGAPTAPIITVSDTSDTTNSPQSQVIIGRRRTSGDDCDTGESASIKDAQTDDDTASDSAARPATADDNSVSTHDDNNSSGENDGDTDDGDGDGDGNSNSNDNDDKDNGDAPKRDLPAFAAVEPVRGSLAPKKEAALNYRVHLSSLMKSANRIDNAIPPASFVDETRVSKSSLEVAKEAQKLRRSSSALLPSLDTIQVEAEVVVPQVCAGFESSYPRAAAEYGGGRMGDPVADSFSVHLQGDRAIMVLTDGCNWGKKPTIAANVARNAFVKYLLQHHENVANTRVAAKLLIRGVAMANEAVMAQAPKGDPWNCGTTTLIGGILMPVDLAGQLEWADPMLTKEEQRDVKKEIERERKEIKKAQKKDKDKHKKGGKPFAPPSVAALPGEEDAVKSPLSPRGRAVLDANLGRDRVANALSLDPTRRQWVFVCISIGDCKAYHYSRSTTCFTDVTKGNRTNICDPTDPGGRLGPYLEGAQSDMRNLELHSCLCEDGDLITLVSDGVHDNFDPENLGLVPRQFMLAFEEWEDIPRELGLRAKDRFSVALMREQVLREADRQVRERSGVAVPITPEQVVDRLVQHSLRVTQSSRDFMENNPNERLPSNYIAYPGKVDHTSAICVEVGPPYSHSHSVANTPTARHAAGHTSPKSEYNDAARRRGGSGADYGDSSDHSSDELTSESRSRSGSGHRKKQSPPAVDRGHSWQGRSVEKPGASSVSPTPASSSTAATRRISMTMNAPSSSIARRRSSSSNAISDLANSDL